MMERDIEEYPAEKNSLWNKNILKLLQCDHMKLGIADRLLSILAKMNKISAQPQVHLPVLPRSARIVFLQLSKILSPYYKKGFIIWIKSTAIVFFMFGIE